MRNVFSVGLGGILGTLARYFICAPFNSYGHFPWGTLTVNLLGSFFLAFFLTLALRHFYHRSLLVLSVSTGFTGAFTTFSSVSVEAASLTAVNPALGLAYVTVSFTAGLALAFCGRQLGNSLATAIDRKIRTGEASDVE